ncbi:hypothetical protein JOL62DRAFT_328138 [Phyllosticta paracitricarpa]|uniref:Uncharacterized protein n=1 Tax=Phyllosticta paracitricarpa TaxID=2016321 RepID=A0ABR1MUL9_9PEZI
MRHKLDKITAARGKMIDQADQNGARRQERGGDGAADCSVLLCAGFCIFVLIFFFFFFARLGPSLPLLLSEKRTATATCDSRHVNRIGKHGWMLSVPQGSSFVLLDILAPRLGVGCFYMSIESTAYLSNLPFQFLDSSLPLLELIGRKFTHAHIAQFQSRRKTLIVVFVVVSHEKKRKRK